MEGSTVQGDHQVTSCQSGPHKADTKDVYCVIIQIILTQGVLFLAVGYFWLIT